MRGWTVTALRALRWRRDAGCARGLSAAADVSAMSDAEKVAMLRSGVAPASGRPMRDVAADVWGWNKNPVPPGQRSGAKILSRPLRGPMYLSWYPPRPSENKLNPYRLTEKQERWRAKLRLLRAAGKGPPKKGAGKRRK